MQLTKEEVLLLNFDLVKDLRAFNSVSFFLSLTFKVSKLVIFSPSAGDANGLNYWYVPVCVPSIDMRPRTRSDSLLILISHFVEVIDHQILALSNTSF